MSKDGWKYLPTDILRIVFCYLEENVVLSQSPIKTIYVASSSLFQCRLTCKSWSALAHSKAYSCVVLRESRQLDLLVNVCSSTKDLVHYIIFDYSKNDTNRNTIIPSIRTIALNFAQVKIVYAKFNFKNEVWQTVQSERARGLFSKLQVIPFTPAPEYDDVLQYNAMAWGLRDQLRELDVYGVVPLVDTERLSHFTNLNAISFKLLDFNHLYLIDQQVQKSSSVRYVVVIYYGLTNHTRGKMISTVHALPWIRQLKIRSYLHDSNLYSYIMQVFPNLDKLIMQPRNFPDAGDVLSTEIAVQFLRYLLHIRYVSVSLIPLQVLEQVLIAFYDHTCRFKILHINYYQNRTGSLLSTLSVHAHTKDKMKMEVNCAENLEKITLPRLGVLEKNGNSLTYIRINMGIDMDDLEVDSKDSYFLSSILRQCPCVKSIYIESTLLRTFGTSLQEQKIPFVQKVALDSVLVYESFLFDMSVYFTFIETFLMDCCRFGGDTMNNVSIRMPETKFKDILYRDCSGISRLCLKLTTRESNTTRWFVGYRGGHDVSSENEYQSSLKDKKMLSLFIECKQLDAIYFRNSVSCFIFESIFK